MSRTDVETLRRETDIVVLIREEVPLVRYGSRYIGPCPFEETDAESLEVHRRDGFFYCSDCGRQGDIFDWVMKLERSSPAEAVATIAARYERFRLAA